MRSTVGMIIELEDVGMTPAPSAKPQIKPQIEEVVKWLEHGEYEDLVKEIANFPLLMFHGFYIEENQKLSLLLFILMTENIFLQTRCSEIASSSKLAQMYDATVAIYHSSKHAKLFDRSTASNEQIHIFPPKLN